MKRLITVIIACMLVITFAFTFAACNDNATGDNIAKEPSGEQTEIVEPAEEEPKDVYYTVSFDTGGVAEVSSQSVKSGEKATKPDEISPTIKDNIMYTFKGWEIDGKAFDFETGITADTIIKAKWETEQYTQGLIPRK